MLKEHASVFRKVMIVTDLGIVAVSFFLGYLVRNIKQDLLPLSSYMGLLPIQLVIWAILLYLAGMYNSFRIRHFSQILFIIFKAAFFGFFLFTGYTYLLKLHHMSRVFIVLTFLFSAFFISLEKAAAILFFRHIRKKGYNFRSILIVGTGRRAQQFIDVIHSHSDWGLKIVGLVDEDATKLGKTVSGEKVIGTFNDIPNIIHNNIVDEVMFVVPRSWLKRIEEIMHFCENAGIKVSVAVDYFKLKLSRAKQSDIGGLPLLSFESTSNKLWHLLSKRVFDVIASLTALFLLSPFFAIISAVIKTTSKGPVFFKQERASLNGRKFALFKFRTMTEGAEERLKELLKHNEMNGPVFKIEKDPRLTSVGKFLRKSSIDELPQLWNVLKGDMSLVGPRPPLPKEVQSYDNWQRRRLSMRPGITCLWQANGRNRISDFNEWTKLDLEYIDNWSLGLDFKILLKTIPAVLFARGAK